MGNVGVVGDKHGSIDVEGNPICTSGKLQAQTSSGARRVCGRSLIGEGKTDVEVKFPEQKPIVAHSDLLAFNGGSRGGVTILFIHACLTAPVTARW